MPSLSSGNVQHELRSRPLTNIPRREKKTQAYDGRNAREVPTTRPVRNAQKFCPSANSTLTASHLRFEVLLRPYSTKHEHLGRTNGPTCEKDLPKLRRVRGIKGVRQNRQPDQTNDSSTKSFASIMFRRSLKSPTVSSKHERYKAIHRNNVDS